MSAGILSLVAKANIGNIVTSHVKTMRVEIGNGRSRYSRSDFTIFYIVPVFLGIALVGLDTPLSADAYSVSISVFSIFAALLFSAQVAMYGIFRAQRQKPQNQTENAIQREAIENETDLLREVNTNVSYLILVSCVCVSIFFVCHVFKLNGGIARFLLYSLFAHFILTLLMLIKRSHLLFDNSYRS